MALKKWLVGAAKKVYVATCAVPEEGSKGSPRPWPCLLLGAAIMDIGEWISGGNVPNCSPDTTSDAPLPVGHPVVQMSDEARRMLALGSAPIPKKVAAPDPPLKGSIADRIRGGLVVAPHRGRW